jgi:hypothetical protein
MAPSFDDTASIRIGPFEQDEPAKSKELSRKRIAVSATKVIESPGR